MTCIIESQIVNGTSVEIERFSPASGFGASSYRVTVDGQKVFGFKDFGYQENYKAWEAICYSLLLAIPKAEAV